MSQVYIFLSLLWYFIVLLFIFYSIYKRLQFTTKRHIKHTKVEWIMVIQKKLLKMIFVLFLVLYLCWSYLILLYL